MSIKLDVKDMKLLAELDVQSRQSLGQIGTKVGLPKNVVAYRIKRMEEKGIIKNYYVVTDASRLGYTSLRFYLTFQYTTKAIEKEIRDYFVKSSLSWWVGRGEPLYDLCVVFWVKDYTLFHEFWKKTLERYGNYFKEYTICTYIKLNHYDYAFLRGKEHRMKLVTGGNSEMAHDEKDLAILKLLAKNARRNITDIAQKTGLTVNTVKSRIKNLTEKKIILGYRTNFDLNKLGLIFVKININFQDYKKVSQVIGYVEQHQRLTYIDFTIGYADLEIEYLIENLEDITIIVEDIKDHFPHAIRDYNYFIYKEIYKVQFVPDV